ncbi:hypothetical protein EDEG_02657 [Edhazardia aedis USNM 41457]|uniref:Uncharacterized protein n=1 Tax=Edhazardia aedis (strain USNM 41457) TaxID=1003232 RepID=J9DK13_EDHAE|nr:hypothetical protein EDEG_02657 [Edhazardia aedis USNM 41457]|eukprot:EJW02955.1 hypothetical protein EDEG_02657 [Edhazardia aedis USNM 41457]
MRKGTAEEYKILNQKIFRLLVGEYENQGTIYYNIPPSKVWYNMTEFTSTLKNIQCVPIKIALESYFKHEKIVKAKKLGVTGIKSHPEDVLIDKNVCSGIILIPQFFYIQTIANCFDSNNNLNNPFIENNKNQINFDFLVAKIRDSEYYEQNMSSSTEYDST